MWNSLLIPLFFISCVTLRADDSPPVATAAAAPVVTTVAPSQSGPPSGAAPGAAPVADQTTVKNRHAVETKLGYAGASVVSVAYEEYTSYEPASKKFFIGHHEEQLSAIFKTGGKSFSFYLWPREVCSVVQVSFRSSPNDINSTPKMITFKSMEQRVEQDSKGFYYPYTKVEFKRNATKYMLTQVGENEKNERVNGIDGKCEKCCRPTYCPNKNTEISGLALDYVMITTNNPFCSIRLNSDLIIDGATDLFHLPTGQGNSTSTGFAISKNGRQENRKTSVPDLVGLKKGVYHNNTKDPKCCPRMANLFSSTMKFEASYPENVTVAEYTFKNSEIKNTTDIGGRTQLKSFLLEIQEPEKCPWVRLCFAVADVNAVEKGCTKPEKNLEIFPKNGIMIRTDDDQAVMLGATLSELRTFRLELSNSDDDATKEDTDMLALRYGFASDVQTGINEFMKLELKPANGEYTIVLQRGPGCNARLNNDLQQSSLIKGKSPNRLRYKKCECYVQEKLL